MSLHDDHPDVGNGNELHDIVTMATAAPARTTAPATRGRAAPDPTTPAPRRPPAPTRTTPGPAPRARRAPARQATDRRPAGPRRAAPTAAAPAGRRTERQAAASRL